MILIYTTHPDKTTAETISKQLITEKLIACVNYLPIEACLIWNQEMNTEHEIVALYKTNHSKWNELVSRIEKLHPYEVPCIIKIEAQANQSYENWVDESVTD